MKYTMKDVIEKKIAVKTGMGADYNKFMVMCENAGLRWSGGQWPTKFEIPYVYGDKLTICIGFMGGRSLGYSPYTFYEENGYTVIAVDDIVDDTSTAPSYRIVIECSNDVTTATMEVNGKPVKTATAKRNPVDKFNFHTGAEIAFNRLFEKKESKDSGFKVGDRVECIEKETWNYRIAGKKGTILQVTPTDVLVEFDDDVNGHAGGWGSDIKGKPGHCWYVRFDKLRHV